MLHSDQAKDILRESKSFRDGKLLELEQFIRRNAENGYDHVVWWCPDNIKVFIKSELENHNYNVKEVATGWRISWELKAN